MKSCAKFQNSASKHQGEFRIARPLKPASHPRGLATSIRKEKKKWSRRDSNPRHLACKASALPTELRPRCGLSALGRRLSAEDCADSRKLIAGGHLSVGAPRLELGTSALSGLRSNQLSYAPAYGK